MLKRILHLINQTIISFLYGFFLVESLVVFFGLFVFSTWLIILGVIVFLGNSLYYFTHTFTTDKDPYYYLPLLDER